MIRVARLSAAAVLSCAASCGAPAPKGPAVYELGFYPTPGTAPCEEPTNMHLHFTVQGADEGANYVVTLSGPGLPTELAGQLPANLTVDKDYPIVQGSGIWTANVVSVAGKTPTTDTGGHLSMTSKAVCSR